MTYRQRREGTAMLLRQRRCIRDEYITPGVIVVYTLRPDQRPRHPEKEWRGKVVCYYRDFQRAVVVSLEEGYEGCDEDVRLEQVVRIEKSVPTATTLPK
jgi:hypothetical protein